MGKFFIEEFQLLCFILCNNGDEIGDGENDNGFLICGVSFPFMLPLLLLLSSLEEMNLNWSKAWS